MPLPLFLAEIMSHTMRAENKSSLADFLTERVNPTLRKCCFVHRWLISLVAAIVINQKKQSIIFGGFSARAAWTLCYREGLDYYRTLVLFDGYRRQSRPLTQRQEFDAQRTWCRLWEEVLQGERFHCMPSISCTIDRRQLRTVFLRRKNRASCR